MGHAFDRGDDRALERGLWVGAVVDEVEAVGRLFALGIAAVARRARGDEFVGVAVGRLVEVDVQEERSLDRCDQLDQRGGFARRPVGPRPVAS